MRQLRVSRSKTHRDVVFVIESCLFVSVQALRAIRHAALSPPHALTLLRSIVTTIKWLCASNASLALAPSGGGLRLSDAMSTPFATATLHSAIASVRCAADKLPSAFGSSFNGASRSIFAVLKCCAAFCSMSE